MDNNFEPDNRVLTRFAEAFSDNSSLKKTNLHQASRIRWDSFVKYLSWLHRNNYIECRGDEKAKTYVLTKKGEEMFDMLSKFLELIKSNKIAVLPVMLCALDHWDDIIDFLT